MRSGHASAWAIGRAHVRARRAAPAPSRRRTRPASARCSAGAPRPRPAPAGRPNSRQASISSSPLFISVAESTEILRPMTQFGCAQAWPRASRVASASRGGVAERAAGGGQQHAPHARRRARPARAAGGRHWKIALCSLSIGSSVAPDACTAASSSGPGHDQRFLVGEQQALAGARGGQRRAQSGRADDRRHDAVAPPAARASSSSAAAPASTRVPGRLVAQQRACSSAAAASSASAAYRGRNCRHLRAPASPRCVCAASATTRKRSRMPREHVQRAARRLSRWSRVRRRPIMARPRAQSGRANSTGAAAGDAVDAIQHAAVPGKQRAAVLEAGEALEQALGQVADDRERHRAKAQRHERCSSGRPKPQRPPAIATSAPAACRRARPSQVLPGRHLRRELARARSAGPRRYAPMSAAHTSSSANSTHCAPARQLQAQAHQREPGGHQREHAGERRRPASPRAAARARPTASATSHQASATHISECRVRARCHRATTRR